MSDDWGVGLGMHLTGISLDFRAAVSAGFVLQAHEIATTARTPKRGPAKSPDFVAVDGSFTFHVIECKGTQVTLANSANQMQSGVAQKDNLNLVGVAVGEKLVTGAFLPQATSSDSATLAICDPDAEHKTEIRAGKEDLGWILLRGELASALQLAGLPLAARLVALDRCGELADDELKLAGLGRRMKIRDIDAVGVRSSCAFQDPTSQNNLVILHVQLGVAMDTLKRLPKGRSDLLDYSLDSPCKLVEKGTQTLLLTPAGLVASVVYEVLDAETKR
jgi:hypothetical protein